MSEAEELLQKNLEAAKSSLRQVEEDLDFVKDQCTTVEVGIHPTRGGTAVCGTLSFARLTHKQPFSIVRSASGVWGVFAACPG